MKTLRHILLGATATIMFCSHSLAQTPLASFREIKEMKTVGNKLFLAADDGYHGVELWVNDGTPDGTSLLSDIYRYFPGSNLQNFFQFDGRLFFSANDGASGQELWVSDGTASGTKLFADLAGPTDYPEEGHPSNFTIFSDQLFFTTAQGKLVRTNGDDGNIDLIDSNPSGIKNPTVVSDRLYYVTGQNTIMWTDGSDTFELVTPDFGETYVQSIYVAGPDLIVYAAGTNFKKVVLYRYNLADNDWQVLVDKETLITGSFRLGEFTLVGQDLFFSLQANDSGVTTDALWATNGSPAGTRELKSFPWTNYYSRSGIENLIRFNDRLYFRSGLSTGFAIWTSDGTSDGTLQLSEVKITDNINQPFRPAVFKDQLYFTGEPLMIKGAGELWSTDGSTFGTVPFMDFDPATGSYPHLITPGENDLFVVTTTVQDGGGTDHLWAVRRAPFISVKDENNFSIQPDSQIPLEGVPIHGCVEKHFTIQNHGQKELYMDKVTISGRDFFLVGEIPRVLKPMESRQLIAVFNPSIEQASEALLQIYSNSATNSIYSFTLKGVIADFKTAVSCNSVNNISKILFPADGQKSITVSPNHIDEMLPIGTTVGVLAGAPVEGASYVLLEGEGDHDNTKFIVEGDQLKSAVVFEYHKQQFYTIRAGQLMDNILIAESDFQIYINYHPTPPTDQLCSDELSKLDFRINDLEFNSANSLFAVTNDGRILKSTDNADSWISINSGVKTELRRIIFKGDKGFILGNGLLLKSDDNGTSWFQVYVPFIFTGEIAISGCFLDEENGFVSNIRGELFYTADGGKSWLKRSETVLNNVSNLSFWDRDNGLAITSQNQVLKTGDGGLSWESVDLNAFFGDKTGIGLRGQSEAFIGGSSGILRTTDKGTNWTKINMVGLEDIRNIEFFDSNTGCAYGGFYNSSFFITENGGSTWISRNVLSAESITGLAVSPVSSLILTSGAPYSNNNGRSIAYTLDQGASWSLKQNLIHEIRQSISFPTTEVGYLFGRYTDYKTTDSGLSWQSLNWTRPPNPILDSYFVDDDNGIISDKTNLFRTTDGGVTLTQLTVPADPDGYTEPGRLYGFDNTLIFAYSGYSIFRSVNAGADWDLIDHEDAGTIDLHFVTPAIGFRSNLFDRIQKTLDGGESWTTISDPSPDFTPSTAIFFLSETVGYKIAGKRLGKSTDGGITWNLVDDRFLGDLVDLYFVDEFIGTVVGKSYLYKTVDGGETWSIQPIGVTEFRDVDMRADEVYICSPDYLMRIAEPQFKTPVLPGYINGPEYVCQADSQIYRLADLPNSSKYIWDSPDTSLGVTQSATKLDLGQSGQIILKARIADNCGGLSETRSTVINVSPNMSLTIIGPDEITADSRNINYHLEKDTEATLATSWTVPDAISFITLSPYEIKVNWKNEIKQSEIQVIGTDVNSFCKSSAVKIINIIGENIVAVEDPQPAVLSIFPNPTDNQITIRTNAKTASIGKIFDPQGFEHFSFELAPAGDTSISLEHLPPGLYILKISIDGGKSFKVVRK